MLNKSVKGNLGSTALKYLNADAETKAELIKYYNENCVKYVKKSRKYNMKETDNWCAMFTSVIAHKCGYEQSAFPYEVSVLEQVELAKLKGAYSRGVSLCYKDDLIIYNWQGVGVPDHVGIVLDRSGDTIRVIEGNYRNTVGIRVVKLDSLDIQGFILI